MASVVEPFRLGSGLLCMFIAPSFVCITQKWEGGIYWTHLNFDMMMALDEKSDDHQSFLIHQSIEPCMVKMSLYRI